MKADEKLIKGIEKFNDAFPDGIFSYPRSTNEPKVKVRALWDYCQERGGIEPKDLSQEELKKFLVF
ncbi:hypothetical protein [Cytobacillus praedii]|uniref:hypothetical protein n=1 Tax=Cytobacillus praedii TaxID=1742358 RepID=UPI002E202F4B|nr:hypothetical protein [Cytobacillus praedii]